MFGAFLFAAFHDYVFAGVDGGDLGSCCLVLVEQAGAWCGVDDPEVVCAVVVVDGGVDCCLSCGFCDLLDVQFVVVVGRIKASEGVGELVVVNGDVTWFAVLADVVRFSRCGPKEAP